MTLEELKKRYYITDVEQLTKLLGLRQKDTVVAVNGIKGSALAFIAALAAEKSPDTQLLLFRDSEEAAFFYNDMEILLNDRSKSLQEKRVLYLPSSYKRNSRWG